MMFPKPSESTKIFPPTKLQQLNFHQAFTNLQNHCSNFLQNLSSLCHLQNNNISLPNLTRFSSTTKGKKNPVWATISDTQMENIQTSGTAMSDEAIEERLDKVPVYAVSNSKEEFVVASKDTNGQSLALLCFKKEDAETLLEHMKSVNRRMRRDSSKVVPVPLNKVFQLKVEGVSFRLVPDFAEVINAVWKRKMDGNLDDGFWGVPVFQSTSLVVTYQDKSYRPAFFRMEDLEKTLHKTASQQNASNHASRQGDIQVAVFEEIIQGMKDNSTSTWDDVIFVPPGFDSVHHTEEWTNE